MRSTQPSHQTRPAVAAWVLVPLRLFLGLTFALFNIPLCMPLILSAERIAGLLKRSPKATRIVDWLFASVLGGFALKLVLTHSR